MHTCITRLSDKMMLPRNTFEYMKKRKESRDVTKFPLNVETQRTFLLHMKQKEGVSRCHQISNLSYSCFGVPVCLHVETQRTGQMTKDRDVRERARNVKMKHRFHKQLDLTNKSLPPQLTIHFLHDRDPLGC